MIRRIFNSLPDGTRERIKLHYYNWVIRDFSFSLEKGMYRTKKNGWSVYTMSPLYLIVKDVKRYEKFFTPGEGDVIIDAGANEGILSLIFSRKVKETGKVYAFEPDKKNIEILKKNIALNKDVDNIQLHEKGLWKENSIIGFYEAGTVGSSVYYPGRDALKKEIEVISVDEFVRNNNIERLDFIKMDVEGAEIEILPGAIETIKSLKPNFAIASYHIIDKEYTYKKLENFFKKIGYPCRTVFYRDGEIITYAGENF